MTDDVVGGDLVEPVTSDILLLEVIRLAEAESGIVEDSVLGQNRGVRVDEYIRSTHLDPAANPPHGYPWCMCFVYWAFEQAVASLGQSNPCVRTASVVAHWEKTSGRKVSAESNRGSAEAGKGAKIMFSCKENLYIRPAAPERNKYLSDFQQSRLRTA